MEGCRLLQLQSPHTCLSGSTPSALVCEEESEAADSTYWRGAVFVRVLQFIFLTTMHIRPKMGRTVTLMDEDDCKIVVKPPFFPPPLDSGHIVP